MVCINVCFDHESFVLQFVDIADLAFSLFTVIVFMHLVIKRRDIGFVFLDFKMSLSKFNMLRQKTNLKAFVKKKIDLWAFVFNLLSSGVTLYFH